VVNPTNLTWVPLTTAGITGYNIGVRVSGTGSPGNYPASSTYAVNGQYTSYILLVDIIPPLANGTYLWAIQSVSGASLGTWSAEQGFVLR
jgi:hypothetical protein